MRPHNNTIQLSWQIDQKKFTKDYNTCMARFDTVVASLQQACDKTKGKEKKKIIQNKIVVVKKIRTLTKHLARCIKELSIKKTERAAKNYQIAVKRLVEYLTSVNAFRHDAHFNPVIGNTAFWSKIHARMSQKLADKSQGVTLESSLAGVFFNDINWGTEYSFHDDNPLKQFWSKISDAFAKSAQGDLADLHVFLQIIQQTNFWGAEREILLEKINKNEIKAINLHVHAMVDNKDRAVYLQSKLPTDLKPYDNGYIFIKEPAALYFIKENKAELLNIADVKKFGELVKSMKTGDAPLVAPETPLRQLKKIISAYPGHEKFSSHRNIYLRDVPPLNLDDFQNSYVFTPKALYYIKDGKIELLGSLDISVTKLIQGMTPTSMPLVEPPAPLRQLQQIIAANPGHERYRHLKELPELVQGDHLLKSQADLDKYLKAPDASFRAEQNTWFETQKARTHWDSAIKHLRAHSILSTSKSSAATPEKSPEPSTSVMPIVVSK